MKGLANWLARLGGLALLAGLGACASVPPDAGRNPADPFERVNRQVYSFNDHFDRAIVKPVAKGYTAVVPKPVRQCVYNVFENIFEITSMVNLALQGRPRDVGMEFGRFVMNSTFGLFGCFDVAQHIGLEKNRQYFALTMGKWGLTPGPYLVLPFLGPSSVRDALGEIPDYFTDPISYITPVKDSDFVYAGRYVVKRAQLLDATNLLEQAALDPYVFVRDAYMQRTRSRVYDGNPPPLPEEEDPDSPAADQPPGGGSAPSPARRSGSDPPADPPPSASEPGTDFAN
ncbi:Lipoprotein [Burkholderiales bacterium]|nr:Lipoprotein [Burkholderiales bacterium]